MSGCELRAHHALCIGFFRGKGYSAAFVENLSALVGALRASDPLLTLQSRADGLCRRCPHDCGGRCESADKVARYDAAALRLLGLPEGTSLRRSALAALRLLGLPEGTSLRRSALAALVRERIVNAGRLGEVCGDCQWHGLCAAAEYHL